MIFRQIACSNSSLYSRETSLVFLVMELPSPEKKQQHQIPHHQCLHLSCTSCYTSAKAAWAKNPKETKRPPNSHGLQSHISHRGSTARARKDAAKQVQRSFLEEATSQWAEKAGHAALSWTARKESSTKGKTKMKAHRLQEGRWHQNRCTQGDLSEFLCRMKE